VKFICGIHEKQLNVKNPCREKFQTYEALIEHVKLKHTTALGKGRRSAKGTKK